MTHRNCIGSHRASGPTTPLYTGSTKAATAAACASRSASTSSCSPYVVTYAAHFRCPSRPYPSNAGASGPSWTSLCIATAVAASRRSPALNG